jgi:hypothetical protein
MRTRLSVLFGVSMSALLVAAAAPGTAGANPTVSLAPEVSSGGLGGLGSVNATLHVAGEEYGGFPPPVARIVLRLPLGTTLSAGDHSTCSTMTLEQVGPSGCSKSSVAGPVGKARGVVAFGSERVEEEATVQSFFAPGGGASFFIDGHSPVSLEILASATVAGNVIDLEVPLVSTVPGAPFASLTEVELRLGETLPEEENSGLNSGLVLSSNCTGRMAWSASVTFDEGGSNPITPEVVESAAETGCPAVEQGPRRRLTAAQKKAEEEAAVKKRQQEEAELVALRAEVKRLLEELKAAVKIGKVKITAKAALVTVKTSEPGTVTISGQGLRKTAVKLAAGTHHIKVALTKFGKAERRGRKQIKLAVSLKVGKRSVPGAEKVRL